MYMIIQQGTIFYQSMGQNIVEAIPQSPPNQPKNIVFRYPAYFTDHYIRANSYIGLNRLNKCGIFRTNKSLNLLNLSPVNKTNPRVLEIVNFKGSTEPATNLLVTNIFKLCFGFSKDKDELIGSIDYLLRNIRFIDIYIKHFIEQNEQNNIYAGFYPTAAGTIHLNLINYQKKITEYGKEILPTRVSDRDLDLLLISILKQYRIQFDGYFCEEYRKTNKDIFTSNEIIKGPNNVVPTEICLFNGYKDVELILIEDRCTKYQKKYLKYKNKYLKYKNRIIAEKQ